VGIRRTRDSGCCLSEGFHQKPDWLRDGAAAVGSDAGRAVGWMAWCPRRSCTEYEEAITGFGDCHEMSFIDGVSFLIMNDFAHIPSRFERFFI